MEAANHVSNRWRDRELAAAIDTASFPTYALLLGWTGVFLASFPFVGFSWAADRLHGTIFALFTLLACSLLLRRYGHPRVAGPIEAFALLSFSSLLAMASTAMLSATDFPLADDALAIADRSLGFDWLSLWRVVNRSPILMDVLTGIYHSIFWQPLLLFPLLFACGRGARCWVMLNAWMIGLVLSVMIFPLFPAKAAFNYYHVMQPSGSSAANFWPIMEAIRDHDYRNLDHHSVRGMITFPSFHAASGVYLLWAGLGLRRLQAPMIALNVIMIFTAIPIGGHYLVDLIGGILIAVATLWLVRRISRSII